MKESDYINVRNLSNLKNIILILNDIMIDGVIIESEKYKEISGLISKWIFEYHKIINADEN